MRIQVNEPTSSHELANTPYQWQLQSRTQVAGVEQVDPTCLKQGRTRDAQTQVLKRELKTLR